jgi:hypothetical protein
MTEFGVSSFRHGHPEIGELRHFPLRAAAGRARTPSKTALHPCSDVGNFVSGVMTKLQVPTS